MNGRQFIRVGVALATLMLSSAGAQDRDPCGGRGQVQDEDGRRQALHTLELTVERARAEEAAQPGAFRRVRPTH